MVILWVILPPLQLACDFHFDAIDVFQTRVCSGTQQGRGFAIQLATVRFLGTLFDDPIAVPAVVIVHVARQLEISHLECLP